jgi:hypothetical protein
LGFTADKGTVSMPRTSNTSPLRVTRLFFGVNLFFANLPARGFVRTLALAFAFPLAEVLLRFLCFFFCAIVLRSDRSVSPAEFFGGNFCAAKVGLTFFSSR